MVQRFPRWGSGAALLLLLLVPVPGFPQTHQVGPGLDEVIASALRANPDLVLAGLREDSARGEQRIARAVPPLALAAIPQVPYQYSVTAPIDLGPQRLFRTRAAGHAVIAARADAVDARQQIVFVVRQGFYDVLLAEAQRDIARQQRDIFARLLATDSARFAAGDVPQLNVTRSEVALARADADLTRADAAVHAARLSLQLLMGVEQPDTAFTVRGDLVYRPVNIPLDSVLALATVYRPDLEAARERIVQGRATRNLSVAQLVPTPAVSLVYQNGVPFNSGSNYALGVGLSLPLFYWNGGERERARSGLEAAEVQERRARAQAANDVQTALDAYRSTRQLAERYQSGLLQKAEAAREAARYAYGTGATSLLDLLDAIRTYGETRADFNAAIHDYWVSVYAVDRAVGKDLVP
jgi:cobalt-zinc-cadmium efflux system outer membrane protein